MTSTTSLKKEEWNSADGLVQQTTTTKKVFVENPASVSSYQSNLSSGSGNVRHSNSYNNNSGSMQSGGWVEESGGVFKLEQPRQRVYVDKQPTQVNVNEGKDLINITEMAPEIMIKENAPRVEVLQKTVQADISMPPAQVDINQPTPRIFLEQQAPIIDVNQCAPRVEFIQREPLVHVNQPKAQVVINQQKPEVKIQSAKPCISVAMCEAPHIKIQQQEPVIKLFKSEPIIRISELKGQPEIILKKAENCTLNWKPMQAPLLHVSKSNMTCMSGSNLSQPANLSFRKDEFTQTRQMSTELPSTTSFEKNAAWLQPKGEFFHEELVKKSPMNAPLSETSYVPVQQI